MILQNKTSDIMFFECFSSLHCILTRGKSATLCSSRNV